MTQLRHNLLPILNPLHQDAVLWRCNRHWEKATNPDEQIKQQENIVNLLLSIKNDLKRNAYVDRISEDINDRIKSRNEQLAELDKKIKDHQKEITKEERKKNSDADHLNKLRAEADAWQKEFDDLKTLSLPKLPVTDLKSMLKDEKERREREAKKKEKLQKKDGGGITYPSQIGLPMTFRGDLDEANQYGIAEDQGILMSRRDDNNWVEISNFTMKIIYFVKTGDETAYRLVSMKNVFNEEAFLNIDTDHMTSVSSFKKLLFKQGRYSYRGNEVDLTKLNEWLMKDEKTTKMVNTMGYHAKGRFYAFGNGVLDLSGDNPQFIQADDYGIVDLNDRHYFIPAFSKAFAEKEELYKEQKNFVYIENNTVDFASWSRLHEEVYSIRGVIGQMWLISALFRDVIYSYRDIQCTPILFMYGMRGSGKGKFGDSVTALFGRPSPPISLGTHSTTKGYLRSMAQVCNGVKWHDEYKNNIKKELIEMEKNIFDGIGYIKAKTTNDLQTDSTPVLSALMISGQEMPTIEPALYSRVILLQFPPGKYTDAQKRSFARLKELETQGLSSIICEILRYRKHFVSRFYECYTKINKQMFKAVGDASMDDRFVNNISILLACREALEGKLKFSRSIDECQQILVKNLKDQFKIMQGNDDIGKWWQVVENLVTTGKLVHGRHYRIDGTLLMMKIQDAHPEYQKELVARRDMTALPKPTLEHYLRADGDVFVEYKKVRIGDSKSSSVWAFVFNYPMIQERFGIDLSNAGSIGSGMAVGQTTSLYAAAGTNGTMAAEEEEF